MVMEKNIEQQREAHVTDPVRKDKNKCNQCDYASSYASALRTHLKMHSGEIQTNAIRDGGSTAP